MPLPLYALALAVFVMGTSEFMLAGLLPAIADDLDVAVGTAGLLTSGFAVGMVVGAPALAAFARGWPPRRTLIACLVLFAGCHVVGAATSAFELMLVTRVLSALANAGFLAVALRTVALLVPGERTGRGLAVLLSGTTIATVVGVPAGAVLGAALSWRATFAAVALLCLPALLGILRGVPTTIRGAAHVRPRSVPGSAPGTAPAPTPLPGPAPSLRAELALLRTPRLAVAMSLAALVNAGTFAVFTFLAPVITEVAGLPDAAVPLALVLFGCGSFLGVTIAGRFADHHAGMLLAVAGPLLLGGWILWAAVLPRPVALLALVFVQGVLSFAVGSTLIARVLNAASGAPTMGGSYATAALNIGAVIGPAAGAWILASGAGPLSPVALAATLTAAALLLALAMRRWRPVG